MDKKQIVIFALLCTVLITVIGLSFSTKKHDVDISDEITTTEETITETKLKITACNIDVPFISQLPDFPTGCECISAVMVMNYLGFDLTADEFVDKYLLKSNGVEYDVDEGIFVAKNPNKYFIGNPRQDDGWGCYPGALSRALSLYTDKVSCVDLTGTTLQKLCDEYIANDIPVILWATVDMKLDGDVYKILVDKKANEIITWYSPSHCLVLVGYNENEYIFNDPLSEKNKAYSKKAVEKAFNLTGKKAMIIKKDGN